MKMKKKLVSKIRRTYYVIKNIKYRNVKNTHEFKPNGIILVSHDFERMGAELLLLYMAKYYEEQGIPLLVISRKAGKMSEEFKQYAFVKIIKNQEDIYKYLVKIKSYNYKYAILNTIINGDLVEIFNKLGINNVTAVHELDYVIKQINSTDKAKLVGQNAKNIVFPAKFVRDSFLNITDINTSNVYCMHQGLFLTKGFEVNKQVSRKHLMDIHPKIEEKDIIVLNVATAGYRKGIDIFIDLAVKSLKNNDNVKYIWIGDKTSRHVNSKKKEYNLEEIPNLICPGYVKDKKTINDYYCGTDIFCLTSREEPFGSVVLEAMNAKLPVVAFKESGGYLDVVQDGENGYLCEKSVDDMYTQIMKLKNGDIREKMGEKGHKVAVDFTFEDYCNSFLDILEYPKMNCKSNWGKFI